MEIEIENNDGGLDLLANCWRVKLPFGRIKEMKNPEYYRLIKNESFVGFKRVVTEFLPAGHTRWQLDPIDYDAEDTKKLSRPAMGIVALKRERITSSN